MLVIFENNIIVFSDKECSYGNTGDAIVDWRRWYKKAIKKSAQQLIGAKLWIENHSDRIFLDAKCKNPFPIKIKITPQTKFHLVAVAHGAMEHRKKYFSGGDGGLMLDSRILGDMHIADNCAPFNIGLIDRNNNNFIHVFDDSSYQTVLRELDTI